LDSLKAALIYPFRVPYFLVRTTAADDCIPFAEERELFSCKQNIDNFKLIETEVEFYSQFGPICNVGCCSYLMVTMSTIVEEINATATPHCHHCSPGAITSAASTSSDATPTSATRNSELGST
jgi:hypothetical protein